MAALIVFQFFNLELKVRILLTAFLLKEKYARDEKFDPDLGVFSVL